MRNLIASVKSVLCMLAMQEHVRAQNYRIHQILSDRTETLSEIISSGVSAVAPSTVDSDITV